MSLISTFKRPAFVLAYSAVLAFAFLVRAVNLNYNSAFNDEAIYIVLGKLGVFQGDWWTYNAAAWMAGQPFIYPALAAVASVSGGVVGARFLNVILGVLYVEAMFVFTMLLAKGSRGERFSAGLIAAALAGGSAVAIYVSRLATYDMLSFLLLMAGLSGLLMAQRPHSNRGKWYFMSAVFLLLAFFTKIITAAYIPFVMLYSLLMARHIGRAQLSFWLKYFFLPIVILGVLYVGLNFNSLLTYAHSQVGRDYSPYAKLLQEYRDNSYLIWPAYGLGSLGMLLGKQWRNWLLLTFGAALILLIHLATHRWPTLDKHTLLSLSFIFPVAGIGVMALVKALRWRVLQLATSLAIIAGLVIYSAQSYAYARRYDSMWHNSNAMLAYLSSHVQPGDKVLAEVGASAILANYDRNYPPNVTTFDWFEYQNKTGREAYTAAIRQGYFKYIELDGGDATEGNVHGSMHETIEANLGDNYRIVYQTPDFVIYERAFS